jgi:enolase
MGSPIITSVRGRRVWDSRGNPTVEAEVRLAGGAGGRAIAVNGASTARAEAITLLDGGTHLKGRDVRCAVANIGGEIARTLVGLNADDQSNIDAVLVKLDGTPQKSRLGSNAISAVSAAVAHAAASAYGRPLWNYLARGRACRVPTLQICMIDGGAHAAGRLEIQDVMLLSCDGAPLELQLERAMKVFHATGEILTERGLFCGLADKGGYWPAVRSNEEAIEIVASAIERAQLYPFDEVGIALDLAASHFHSQTGYYLARDGKQLSTDEMIAMLSLWIERYPIVSMEDPLAEDDVEGFRRAMEAIGQKVAVVADDLLATNVGLVANLNPKSLCAAMIVKPSQAGTLTETKAALDAARNSGLRVVLAGRSGDSEDVTPAHLAVAWAADALKIGGFARSERSAKYNELIRISEALS